MILLIKTAYADAVTTHTEYQIGVGSVMMRHLVSVITEYQIACLETDRVARLLAVVLILCTSLEDTTL